MLLMEMDFKELDGATINEKKQAIDLACRRHRWWRDTNYMKRSILIYAIGILISLVILTVLNGQAWFVPIVFVAAYMISTLLAPKQSERIKPYLKQALVDVRQHKYR